MADEKKMSERKMLLKLSDQQIHALFLLAQKMAREEKTKKPAVRYELPEYAAQRLRQIQEDSATREPSADEKKWIRYVKFLCRLDIQPPALTETTDRVLYKELKEKAKTMHLPENFSADILPGVISYRTGGVMKPILLVGPPGCGKTTIGKYMAELVGLPLSVINAPRADTSHGYQGESKSYKSADAGEFFQSMLRSGSFHNFYLIDELDKPVQGAGNRLSQQDELLNILQDGKLFDNFLELPLEITHSPLLFSVNCLEALSKPFLDRCRIIEVKACDQERMLDILHEDAGALLNRREYQGKLRLDFQTLDNASEQLYRAGFTSIRQHKQLLDGAASRAYYRYLESDESETTVTEKDFRCQLEELTGRGDQRHIGFDM